MGRQATNTMTDAELADFGRNVRVRMAAIETTSTELAELVGISKQAINAKMRRGGPDAVAFFSTLLGVSEEALVSSSPVGVGSVEALTARKLRANARKVAS